MMPYNSQNNDALIKECKFALKSVREWQNSAKIYPRAGFAVQKAEVEKFVFELWHAAVCMVE
jgi:hypothetical protein